MSFPPAIDIHWANFAPELALLITAAITTLFALFQRATGAPAPGSPWSVRWSPAR